MVAHLGVEGRALVAAVAAVGLAGPARRDVLGRTPREDMVQRGAEASIAPVPVARARERLARPSWALRFLGVPAPISAWLRGMGQYHHRFSDVPVSLRRRQLTMWDRPPVQGSPDGAWVDLGMASVGLRSEDLELVDTRMRHVAARLDNIEASAKLEWCLLAAYLADAAAPRLREAEALLDEPGLEPDDRACYRARVLDMRAYQALRRADEAAVDEGEALYASIGSDTGLPFVDFRRTNGLAYCALRRGQDAAAHSLALEAASHAGDGGFVRFRVMALSLASRAAEPEVARSLRARADRLARGLEDEDLRARLRRRVG